MRVQITFSKQSRLEDWKSLEIDRYIMPLPGKTDYWLFWRTDGKLSSYKTDCVEGVTVSDPGEEVEEDGTIQTTDVPNV